MTVCLHLATGSCFLAGGRQASGPPSPTPTVPLSHLSVGDFLAALLEAPLWGGVTQPGRNLHWRDRPLCSSRHPDPTAWTTSPSHHPVAGPPPHTHQGGGCAGARQERSPCSDGADRRKPAPGSCQSERGWDTGSPSHTQCRSGQGQLVQQTPGQDLLCGLQLSERPHGQEEPGLAWAGGEPAWGPGSQVSLPWLHPLMLRDVKPGSADLSVGRGLSGGSGPACLLTQMFRVPWLPEGFGSDTSFQILAPPLPRCKPQSLCEAPFLHLYNGNTLSLQGSNEATLESSQPGALAQQAPQNSELERPSHRASFTLNKTSPAASPASPLSWRSGKHLLGTEPSISLRTIPESSALLP